MDRSDDTNAAADPLLGALGFGATVERPLANGRTAIVTERIGQRGSGFDYRVVNADGDTVAQSTEPFESVDAAVEAASME